jgi:hypothetical protein
MKQTAVEWLFEQLCSEKLSWNKDRMGKLFIDLRTSDIFQQAKEMEKEQIVNAYNDCEWTGDHEDGEQYYNETFNKSINDKG